MSQELNNKITIDFVQPTGRPGSDLKGCFFVYDWTNGTYSFFEEGSHKPLKTHLEKGHNFHFRLKSHPRIEWKLHISRDSTPVMVEGRWKDKRKPESDSFAGDLFEPDQSYQATAGGATSDDVNAALAMAQ